MSKFIAKNVVLACAIPLFLASFFVCNSVFAQNSKSERIVKLSEIKTRIEQEKENFSRLHNSLISGEKELNKVKDELKELQKKKSKVQEKILALEKDIQKSTRNLEQMEFRLDEHKKIVRKRMVAVYVQRQNSTFSEYLMSAQSAQAVMVKAKYFGEILKRDYQDLIILKDLLSEFRKDQGALQEFKDEYEFKQNGLSLIETKLAQLSADRSLKLKALKEEEQKKLKVLESLRMEASRLEDLISGITSGKTTSVVEDEQGQKLVSIAPYSGKDFSFRNNSLLWPIFGKVVRNFGVQRHEEFSDILFVKGMEFQGQSGSPVLAVSGGKVVLNQNLPGYGRVIILDHGQRNYSLYARLAEASVTPGAIVNPGEKIASLGDVDSKGKNFYFELRIKGKAVNPSLYLKKETRRR